MNIAIDISPVVFGTGVATYTKNLVHNLLVIDSDNDYVLFGGSLRRKDEFADFFRGLSRGNWRSKILSLPPTLLNFLWNRLHILPIEKFVGDIDVFHSSDWTQPPSFAFKVTTVHDLIPIKFPKLSHPRIVSAHKARIKWVLEEVDRIIVPSVTTSEDLRKMGVEKERIRIIPEAPDPVFKPAKRIEIERMKRKYRINGKYVLTIGIGPRKNTQRIIDAFGKIKAETALKLVIVGHQYLDFGQARGVVFTGHVPQSDLPILYSGASALVYPSLYEGFGLPILEAFACKTPVVTSNFGSTREVAGNGAVLVNPYETDSIAQGVLTAIKSEHKLVEKGSKRLRLFSWKDTAFKTLKVYKEAPKAS